MVTGYYIVKRRSLRVAPTKMKNVKEKKKKKKKRLWAM